MKSRVLFCICLVLFILAIIGLTDKLDLSFGINTTRSAEVIKPKEIVLETLNANYKLETLEETEKETESREPKAESRELKAVKIDGRTYIGEIDIPSIEITLKVQNECTPNNLEVSPCRYTGSIWEDNLVIGGHNYKRHFSKIKRMSIGDKIYFTDMNDNRIEYEICLIERLHETEVNRMIYNDYDLSLFTCDTNNKYRVTLRCNRTTYDK